MRQTVHFQGKYDQPIVGVATKTLSEMTKNLVLLGCMPAMLAEFIQRLASAEPDFEVVTVGPTSESQLKTARRMGADVLVLHRSGLNKDDACLADLLTDHPLSILVVNRDGRKGSLWLVRPTPIAFEPIRGGFTRALRVAARHHSCE